MIDQDQVTIKVVWRALIDVLKQADIPSPVLDARLLLQHAVSMTHEELLMDGNRVVTPAQQSVLENIMQRRLQHEPISRITGIRGFWKSDFIVTPATLDPRADSETLIEAVLEHMAEHPPERILDCGTGTGCLLLSLLQEYPNATGVGLDISPDAVEVAKQNAKRLGLSDRVTFMASDWNDYEPEHPFDVVISNPPYITTDEMAGLSPNVKNYDPHQALWGGDDGLMFYRQITGRLQCFLKLRGWVFFEIGHAQAVQVKEILADASMTVIETRQDLNALDRVVVAKKP